MYPVVVVKGFLVIVLEEGHGVFLQLANLLLILIHLIDIVEETHHEQDCPVEPSWFESKVDGFYACDAEWVGRVIRENGIELQLVPHLIIIDVNSVMETGVILPNDKDGYEDDQKYTGSTV